MSAYRTSSPPPAAEVIDWRWVGFWARRCSRCGARYNDVEGAWLFGVRPITDSATVRHLRECSHAPKDRR